jgi:fructokinase
LIVETASKRPVIYGEVLYDRFPDGHQVLGGAPFNVAWHLHAFGQNPLFISAVGNDSNGELIRQTMSRWGMDTSGLQVSEQYPTGRVSIEIVDGEPCYDIVDHQAYDYIDTAALPTLENASLIYHGSLALRNEHSRTTFEQILQQYSMPRFLDVNLRPPWWQADYLVRTISQADWLKLNEYELFELAHDHGDATASARQLLRDAQLQAIVLTKGEQGADFITLEECHNVVPDTQGEVADTVGAGDAFTSVILTGLLQGWAVPVMLDRAQAFASRIVGVRGATVDSESFYDEVMASWIG